MAGEQNVTRQPNSGPETLLFGPLALSFNDAAFDQLRTNIVDNQDHDWALEVLTSLPVYHTTIAAAIPSLRGCPGLVEVKDLKAALQSGKQLETPFPLPNSLLIPLVITLHLTQFSTFLKQAHVELDPSIDVFAASRHNKETVGFCTGLLSAMAVSSSGNLQEFEKYAAVAVRLGLLVGMVVDAQDASPPGPSKSISAVWNSPEKREEARRIMKSVSEAYISVHYDADRATITAPASAVSDLHSQLRAAGIITADVGLRGRFHSRCYQDQLESILHFCDSHPDFQLPDASQISIPTRSNASGDFIRQGALHQHALRSILVEPPQWFNAFSAVREASMAQDGAAIFSFGPERCVPPSLLRGLAQRVVNVTDLDVFRKDEYTYSENDIAVVGMSCKVAGADNVEEFWDLLCAAQSQHREVPKERFGFETVFRDVADPNRKWFGNFIDGHDQFDHKFFKKSPRESATMDPQQRHFLQIAYQAVEQSGYFHSANPDKNIGCYTGVCSCDYDANIACHAPNAFTATGNLQAFIAGKISHLFGWTGPGLTIDTACSSSAVAVHQACKAIINGECTAALAGGTHVMTNPLWFQNLAGASFLSTTGQCKPFDAKADGYCRGEGVAAVFLKKLSAAAADGDQILGVITATAVQQNQNCTPIFVPNVPSLSDLFRGVVKQSRLLPNDVTVVEAHGTGTAVGDPAEYDSVRTVLGGPSRTKPITLSSVKGLVGHTECTSGIVSLIKVLLMLQKRMIPPQASFTAINPAIKASPSDKITIPTVMQSWDSPFRAALINNYGASGSNASIVVAQAPIARKKPVTAPAGLKYPFSLCAPDDAGLRRYSRALRKFLTCKTYSAEDLSLPNISFNMNRQSNRQLEKTVLFSATSVDELEQSLIAFEFGVESVTSLAPPKPRPVVLCFGGQVSTFIGLDRTVYDNVAGLRKHLNTVDSVARSIGVQSIFPAIFGTTPIQDTVHLQIMLFASQYSCARSWIESGVEPVALVGHSFGELTALCISQALSLEDTVRMIAARAALIRDEWGPEKGAMLAVEADLKDVEKLLAASSALCKGVEPATIACYNGPRSFTLAGAVGAIDSVATTITQPAFSSIKHKRLNVTNAFHCALLDPLLDQLEQSAQSLTFREPIIPIERATESHTEGLFQPRFVADHIRSPVFFNHALQRLAQKYPSAILLEAGSNSTVTNMAGRALGNPITSHFQGISINHKNGWNNLVDATVALWKAGASVHFWAHQSTQSKEHALLLLPPYQFENSRHWTELKEAPKLAAPQEEKTEKVEALPDTLLTFVGYRDSDNRLARFRVNTMIPKYDKLIEGHIIAETAPICPATVQLDLVIEAIRTLRSDLTNAGLEPQIHTVENQAPLCINPARAVWVEVAEEAGTQDASWDFQVFSDEIADESSRTIHTTGRVLFRSINDAALKTEFARYERHFSHDRYLELMRSGDVDEVLQNRTIYKMFAEIVDYGEDYRNVRKLVSKGNQSAGLVSRKYNPESWLDGNLADSFCQVGGIYVNCMTDRSSADMFIANGIEQWIRSPKLRQGDPRPDTYHVLATHHRSDKGFLTDVFAFDSTNGALIEVILGISYVKIPKASMSKLLSRLTVRDPSANVPSVSAVSPASPGVEFFTQAQPTRVTPFSQPEQKAPSATQAPTPRHAPSPKPIKAKEESSNTTQVAQKIKAILAELSGLELAEIKDDSELADLGIDSLMGMEMAHEIEKAFTIKLSEQELVLVTNMPSLMKCVQRALGGDSSSSEHSWDDSFASDDKSTAYTWMDTPAGDSQEHDKSMRDFLAERSAVLELPFGTVMEAFNETKSLTDDRIVEYEQTQYVEVVLPLQSEMCIALVLESFQKLNVDILGATAGQKFMRISHPKEHTRLVDYLYKMLEDANLVNIDGDMVTRTAIEAPRPSKEILEELVTQYPDQHAADKLTFYCGSHLAEVLQGETDGVKLIFGTQEGRELVSNLYGNWPLNRIFYRQMEDFLERLTSKLDMSQGPIKILEVGAGTGGTTKWLVPLLGKLNVPVEYTFTDLGPSFVASARKKFGKQYPFMKFMAHDIEKPPVDDLVGTQHIVVASNAIHATHSLSESTKNIRKMLRPDGFLMMLEMTGTLYWVDIIFGLFQGWWYFDDGRTHAVTHESRWERDLQAVGYGHVDWTDGVLPENRLQKLIIAFASGARYERLQFPRSVEEGLPADCAPRQSVVNRYVQQMTAGFGTTTTAGLPTCTVSDGRCVLVTGGTGSLGCHLVAELASRPDVTRVVCLNRRSRQNPLDRQFKSLTSKGVVLADEAAAKLTVIETDLSKPQLGLSQEEYRNILKNVTQIVHNAWLMNAKWPVHRFEPQLRIMRNLLDLAYEISLLRPLEKVLFQFVSSIATVGHWPLWTGKPNVPENPMTIESVLPTGYGDAKYICELMIDETLRKNPERFRPMVVRLGQVAGSSTSGYWNPMEHLPFVFKSSQTLRALPDFDGVLSWTPVDVVAGTLVDLISLPPDVALYPFYHIDNPVRQPWKQMTPLLADGMDIPRANIIPFDDWVQRVKDYPRKMEGPEGDNPAILLVDFIDGNFHRMSCGGLLLDTKKSREHSRTLANMGPVSEDTARLFIKSWKDTGFLSP